MIDHSPPEESPRLGRGEILSPGFLGLAVAQFLGAMNDNVFRWLVIGLGKRLVGKHSESLVLMEGTVLFVVPFVLLSAVAGYVSDRFSKRSVIVWCKFAEIGILAVGAYGAWLESLPLMLTALFLLGCQAAIYTPAKSGSIPELLEPHQISAANGVFGLLSMVAIVAGMAIGNALSDAIYVNPQTYTGVAALVMILASVIGWGASLVIPRFAAGNVSRPFPWKAVQQTWSDISLLFAVRPMWRVAIGYAFFLSLSSLVQLNIDQYAQEKGISWQSHEVPLLLAAVVGIALGSILAGMASRGAVELGLLPLGAGGVAIASLLLFSVKGNFVLDDHYTSSFYVSCGCLLLLGIGAGLFQVPLEAYMQHRSSPANRGAILATANMMAFAGIMATSLAYWGLRVPIHGAPFMSANQIFLLCGLLTLPVFAYIVCLIPKASIRFGVWLVSLFLYRIRVHGLTNLPQRGGALLAANHISWLDGALLLLVSSRPIRILAWADNFQSPLARWLGNKFGVIFITPKPKALIAALREARAALRNGELVAIFPEGGITRTGQVQGFRPGMLKILEGTGAPVVPVYLDELWGSIFSFQGGRFFGKWPRRWPYPISIHFGRPLEGTPDLYHIRRSVQELGTQALDKRSTPMRSVVRQFLWQCKKRLRSRKSSDSLSGDLTGGKLLTACLLFRRTLRRELLAADEKHVAVLLPPGNAGIIANIALALDQRISVNLNYTVSAEVLNECLAVAGVRSILTSRRFMEKMAGQFSAEQLHAKLIFVEDIKERATRFQTTLAAFWAYAVPAAIIDRSLGLHRIRPHDVLTVIFTSGSTGTPKGVMLTHRNITTNVEAIEQVVHLTPQDTLLGVLPLFHSLGYTVTLWAAMGIDMSGVYHFSPLDGKMVGKMCRDYQCTMLLATPTFLRGYIRRCEKEELATVEVVITGAEKLPPELADAYEQKFGVRPVEGYGATELSPLVSVNVPKSRAMDNFQDGALEGSVGRPIHGVSAKIISLDSGLELGANEQGLLLVKGPNVMLGYMNRADLTAEVIRDGWYVTGDIAFIDDQGFIHITGRESRFSKIGGEMVPHIRIEEELNKILGPGDDGAMQAAVSAVPDERKGERLVVLHTPLAKTPAEICQALSQAGLPNLFIPGADSFFEIQKLPVLGSGKLDLKGIRSLAKERCGAT